MNHQTVHATPSSSGLAAFAAAGLTVACLLSCITSVSAQTKSATKANFERDKLVAWCIVPFDKLKRGPAERAEMIQRLGMKRVAYDWRQEHVATFEQEILEYKKREIEYFAFWGSHPKAFELFKKYDLHPQIWNMFPAPAGDTQADRIANAAKQLLPLVQQTKTAGCKLGLYNHGGWSGEPQNMVAVCQYLRTHHQADHVGIVFNLHHGHHHIDDFAAVLSLMKPHLLCLNLNGMDRNGDQRGRKIVPLGEGEFDVALMKVIHSSGYNGPIGIIGHTQDDVEQRLTDNLNGIDWILPQLSGKPAGKKPKLLTWESAQPKPESPKNGVTNPPSTKSPSTTASPTTDAPTANKKPLATYSAETVTALLKAAEAGNAARGLVQFASAKSACIACHRIGTNGGTVGPDLTEIGKQRKPHEIIEAVLWPARHVKPEYNARMFITEDGKTRRGYVVTRDKNQIVLRDPTKPGDSKVTINIADVEFEKEIGTLMPDNLVAAMTQTGRDDLFRFLLSLGHEGTDKNKDGISVNDRDALLAHAATHSHGPALFPVEREPLHPKQHPHWQHNINRDRVYDFYAKQADYFKQQPTVPELLGEFPGLDGGEQGHWGNQNETVWANNDWNNSDLGILQSGVFRGEGITVNRGVCVRLGDNGEMAACFDPDTLTYSAIWKDGFVKLSSVRHGFVGGLTLDGTLVTKPTDAKSIGPKPNESFDYHGFYRHGTRIIFAYRIGDTEYLDSPSVKDGKFVRSVVPAAEDSQQNFKRSAPAQWPQHIKTSIDHGDAKPYAIDTIQLPTDNPWKSLTYVGGLNFLPDGSALICTMQGDVWRADNIQYPSKSATWKRFAAGLHQPLGMVIDDDGIFVLCRDQITRLHDLNDDGEADFYECFSNAFATSKGGHDYICGLERDTDGNFYTASGNQGIVRISADGKSAEVIATGFRNPDGIGLLPDRTVTVPCSEGTWTPATMICAVRPTTAPSGEPSYHGFGGPKNNQPPALPLVYLPRAIDNSAGGQTIVNSTRWGPLQNQLLHFSFGTGSYHLVLTDEVDGQLQGAAVPLPGEFLSGSHRARFNPADGQLYVGGMQGWGSYTPESGCFQRVRFTGSDVHGEEHGGVQLPLAWRAHENGVTIRFSQPVDRDFAQRVKNQFAQCWNYRYSKAYGSPEYSSVQQGTKGHDVLTIAAVHVANDRMGLFLEIPELQPVNQLHLRIMTDAKTDHDLFATVHKLRPAFTQFPGYVARQKTIKPHPIHGDLKLASRNIWNPHSKTKRGAREIEMKTSGNLSFDTRQITAKPGELLAIKLVNADVVPHNWALVKPGSLEQVGRTANKLISDPDAVLRQYVPDSPNVLAYTDIVMPNEQFTIYFKAPKRPGTYPYLCTFPGHWLVMNGALVVE